MGENRCRGADPGGGEKGRFLGSKPSRAVCIAVVPADACCAACSASACSPQAFLLSVCFAMCSNASALHEA